MLYPYSFSMYYNVDRNECNLIYLMTFYWIDCCNRLIINAPSGSLWKYQKFSMGTLGTYTMDGISNGKGFYKNAKNRDRHNDDFYAHPYLDPYSEDRYLHFSSIINNWMVSTWYRIPCHDQKIFIFQDIQYGFKTSVLLSRYQTNLTKILNLET